MNGRIAGGESACQHYPPPLVSQVRLALLMTAAKKSPDKEGQYLEGASSGLPPTH
jgi:hypothetical protein